MSSILTNNGAMVALQTLKSVNKNLADTQTQISTGKRVADASDNSAVWAISKVMESDVQGFKAISESLSLGKSTVAVARNASETVTDLLTQMKGKIVAAQGDNVDRTKLNADVSALRDQISSVVGAAQFNGLNMVNGTTASTNVLASLDRDNAGNVTSSTISVTGQDLSIGGYTANDVFATGDGTASGDGDAVVLALNGGASGEITLSDGANPWAAGDTVSFTIGEKTASYTLTAADAAAATTADIVAVGLKNSIEGLGISGLTVNYDSGNQGQLVFSSAAGTDDMTITGQYKNAGAGGLGALSSIDVSTSANATAALASIETLIDTAVDASAAFGSTEGRIDIQADFVSNLTDSLKSGIGAMVDADMEATSARLQALQTQQQLGVQALSIANQAPQTILSLFR